MTSCVRPAGLTAHVWRGRGARPLAFLAFALLVVGLVCPPADADPASDAIHHRSPAVQISLLALVSVGGLGLSLIGQRRRAGLASLALLVSIFSFETAIHSVHHLDDSQAAESCALLSASVDTPGACLDSPETGAPIVGDRSPVAVDVERIGSLPTLGSPAGRAPPAASSV